MKNKKWMKKAAIGFLAFAIVLSAWPGERAKAAVDPEVRDINLNLNGTIAGIYDPVSSGAGYWSGNYIHFGNYDNSYIRWRVLDANTRGIFNESPTMLVVSNFILDTWYFRAESWADDANQWLASDARGWMDENIFAGFEKGEQEAVALSTKLTLAEGETEMEERVYAPLKDDRLFLLDIAEVKPAYGYVSEGARGIEGTWWTRTAVEGVNNVQGTFCPIGKATRRDGSTRQGIVPACNLELEKIAFAARGVVEKSSVFAPTRDGSDIRMWDLTLKDGTGFAAKSQTGTAAEPGGDIVVEITALASGNQNPYTQISAMLLDAKGTVQAYGKISDEIQTGNVTVSLPEKLPEGRYVLKVFEESINKDSIYSVTDYASNMADISLKVGDVEEPESETETEKQSESETETETEKQTESETETETEKQPESETETETEKQSESETETETEKQSESETETETEKQSESETETETEKQSESETEIETEKQSESETETEPEKQSESEAETEPEKQPESETETEKQSETKVQEIKVPESETSATSGKESAAPEVKAPSRPKIMKTSRTPESILVRWKKPSKKVSGYQIQYSAGKKFKGVKVRTVTVKNPKAVQKKVTGLKKGKKYYVRMRSYRKAGDRRHYSSWSKKELL